MLPGPFRAARALADMSQRDLAAAAAISVQTVADFERGARQPHPNNLKAIRQVFEAKGILFLEEEGKIVAIEFRKMAQAPLTRSKR